MPRVAQRILDARGFLRSPYAMEPLSLTHSAKGCLSMTKVSADIPSVGFASPNLVQEGWRGGGLEKKNYGKLPRELNEITWFSRAAVLGADTSRESGRRRGNWWCDMVVVFQCEKGRTRREADRLHNVVN